jgi:hypothetical protein
MFAVERGYDPEAQIMGMEMEGIDIAVLSPTVGLSFLARDNMDPFLPRSAGPTTIGCTISVSTAPTS